MKELRFSWDARKARANRQKHGVSFEEAQTVFFDDNGLFLDDPDHSWEEKRFLLLGLSSSLRSLLVCHCFLKEDDIRIFSARRATKRERQQYAERIEE